MRYLMLLLTFIATLNAQTIKNGQTVTYKITCEATLEQGEYTWIAIPKPVIKDYSNYVNTNDFSVETAPKSTYKTDNITTPSNGDYWGVFTQNNIQNVKVAYTINSVGRKAQDVYVDFNSTEEMKANASNIRTLIPQDFLTKIDNIKNNSTNFGMTVEKLVMLLNNTITYDINMVNSPVMLDDVAGILNANRGMCAHFSGLFCAMANAAGIPARTVMGLHIVENRVSSHVWAEVYNNGWIEIEPQSPNNPFFIPDSYIQTSWVNIPYACIWNSYGCKYIPFTQTVEKIVSISAIPEVSIEADSKLNMIANDDGFVNYVEVWDNYNNITTKAFTVQDPINGQNIALEWNPGNGEHYLAAIAYDDRGNSSNVTWKRVVVQPESQPVSPISVIPVIVNKPVQTELPNVVLVIEPKTPALLPVAEAPKPEEFKINIALVIAKKNKRGTANITANKAIKIGKLPQGWRLTGNIVSGIVRKNTSIKVKVTCIDTKEFKMITIPVVCQK